MSASAYEEYAAPIGAHPRMIGVVARPARNAQRRSALAVILLGAGLVHHVGPNRLTVRLARRLAGRGLASLRFDHRGIGDSAPRADGKPFEVGAVEEVREAMDYVEEQEDVHAFVLLGICSGAQTSLNVALEDSRVVGVGMINGGGEGAGTAWDAYEYARRQVRHYLKHAVLSPDSWRRALTGRIQYRRLFGVLAHRIRNRLAPSAEVVDAASETAGEIKGLLTDGVRLLWVHSENDFSRDYFDTMFGKDAQNLIATDRVRLEVIPFIDHTLTARHGQERFLNVVENWLDDFEQTNDAAPGALPRSAAS
jgi:pimeloyl-ACP methyl ester carboxylesterase